MMPEMALHPGAAGTARSDRTSRFAVARLFGPPVNLPWMAVLAFWAAVAVVDQMRMFLLALSRGSAAFDVAAFLMTRSVDAIVWTLITAATVRLTVRYPIQRPRVAGAAFVHLAACIAAALFSVAVNWLVGVLYVGPIPFAPFTATIFHANAFSYVLVAAFAHLLVFVRHARSRAVQAAQLRAELADAQIEVLKAQIEPHFLFNTLNSISELVHENPAAAEQMIDRLEHLLHMAIAERHAVEVPLEREIEFLRAYLEIQQTRFQDRLEVSFEVDDDTRGALVPTFLLQPLVENAIRHGIAPRASRGRVVVSSRRDGPVLRLSVSDDGVGLRNGGAQREGLGLRNTAARLHSLFGPAQRFAVRPGPQQGVEASMEIPFRTVNPLRNVLPE
jgi:two-component system, LytTR family, sensor kinase